MILWKFLASSNRSQKQICYPPNNLTGNFFQFVFLNTVQKSKRGKEYIPANYWNATQQAWRYTFSWQNISKLISMLIILDHHNIYWINTKGWIFQANRVGHFFSQSSPFFLFHYCTRMNTTDHDGLFFLILFYSILFNRY